MWPYILLVLIPTAFYFGEKYRAGGKTAVLTVERNISNVSLGLFFALYLLLLFLRDFSVGCDLVNYRWVFERAKAFNWEAMRESGFEPLFLAFNSLFAWIIRSFRVFIIICAVLSIVPIAAFYMKESPMALLTIALFVGAAPFVFYFSGLRQALAMGLMIPMYYCAKEKRIRAFLIWCVVAALLHKSAVIGLMLYPLLHIRITKRHMTFIAPVLLGVFLLNKPALQLLLKLLGSYGEKYADVGSTGAYGMLALFAVFTAYCFIMPDENQMQEADFGFRNMMLLILVIQIFVPIHTVFMRLGYYFHIFIPVIIPRIAQRTSSKLYKLMQLSIVVMEGFFLIYFIYDGYTDADILQVFPYLFAWQ